MKLKKSVCEVLATMLLTVGLFVFCLAVLALNQGPTMDEVEWQEERYLVREGDTLWALAGRYCPKDMDRREWIEAVVDLNDMQDGLRAGDKITVLVAEEVEQ